MNRALDITRDVCPMTYVRVKLALESMIAGETLEVRLSGGSPLKNVPRSAMEDGHEVKLIEPADNGVWRLVLLKRERP